jgi:hypothetical protein
MATIIKAGNAAGGVAVTPDTTGTLQLKTGTGSGTTALTIDASQNVSLAAALAVTGALSAASITSGGSPVTTTAGFVGSITATGYQRFPSGLIIQWLPSGSGVRSWAIPFPTAVFGAWYTATAVGTSVDNAYITTLSTTQVGLSQVNSTPTGYVIGIGY